MQKIKNKKKKKRKIQLWVFSVLSWKLTLERDYAKTRKPPPPSATAQTKQKHCVTQNFNLIPR